MVGDQKRNDTLCELAKGEVKRTGQGSPSSEGLFLLYRLDHTRPHISPTILVIYIMANVQFTQTAKIKQLRKVESMLRNGATIQQLQQAVGVSSKQIRRYLNEWLPDLGANVTSDFVPGATEPAVYKVKNCVFKH